MQGGLLTSHWWMWFEIRGGDDDYGGVPRGPGGGLGEGGSVGVGAWIVMSSCSCLGVGGLLLPGTSGGAGSRCTDLIWGGSMKRGLMATVLQTSHFLVEYGSSPLTRREHVWQ
eukprot:2834993-Rhodomonas_salina.1